MKLVMIKIIITPLVTTNGEKNVSEEKKLPPSKEIKAQSQKITRWQAIQTYSQIIFHTCSCDLDLQGW